MRRNSEEKIQKRKLLTGYFSVIVSITLVLFFVGFLGLLLLNSKKVASHFKERIAMTVYLKDGTKDIEIKQLQKKITLSPVTKRVNFVSKEVAAERYAKDIGEDFVEFLGYNPLLNSMDVFLRSDYVNPVAMQKMQTELEKHDFISEIVFDQPLVTLLDKNIQKISMGLLFATAVFVLTALLLINSSIRLSIYSKRFIIKTMQLVGATKSFIRRPFILNHLRLGVVSTFIALAGLSIFVYEVDHRFPKLELLKNPMEIALVFGGVVILGITIVWLSTFLVTQRYLNLKTDSIY